MREKKMRNPPTAGRGDILILLGFERFTKVCRVVFSLSVLFQKKKARVFRPFPHSGKRKEIRVSGLFGDGRQAPGLQYPNNFLQGGLRMAHFSQNSHQKNHLETVPVGKVSYRRTATF